MVNYKIRRGNKYNSQERRIANVIYDLTRRQSYFFRKWHELDMEIELLKKKLNGKYQANFKGQKRAIFIVPKKTPESCSLGEHKNHAHAHAHLEKEVVGAIKPRIPA